MKKRLIAIVLLAVCLLPISAFSSAQPKQQGSHEHCVMDLAPIRRGEVSSTVLSYSCYKTFAQAISAATGGRVHLASTVRPQDVTPSMLEVGNSPNINSVIGIEFSDSNYSGRSLTYYTTGPICSSTQSYGVTAMPSGWNDVISSVQGNFHDCFFTVLWSDINYGGVRLVVYASTTYVGDIMNDQTSSIYWRWPSWQP